jgi:hypothetical protein
MGVPVLDPLAFASNPLPYRPYWSFDGAAINAVWATVQVPADIVSATTAVYIWTERVVSNGLYASSMRWGFDAWVGGRAAAGVGSVLVNTTAEVTLTYPIRKYSYLVGGIPYMSWGASGKYMQRDTLGTIAVVAGDIIHVKIYRDPTHGDDTFNDAAAFFGVEFSYTADS